MGKTNFEREFLKKFEKIWKNFEEFPNFSAYVPIYTNHSLEPNEVLLRDGGARGTVEGKKLWNSFVKISLKIKFKK